MRALYLSTRLAGTDGVSLETAKVAAVLEDLGFETVYCAGELDADGPPGELIPAMHFDHHPAADLGRRAFGGDRPDPALEDDIHRQAAELRAELDRVVDRVRPDLLVMQNIWAIPMQLPLAEAAAGLVADRGLPCLSHEHDYYWERSRFTTNRIPEFLDTYFPFDAPRVRHLCINSLARRELYDRRGLRATVVPNVFDFDTPAPGIDGYNHDLRREIGIEPSQRLFLQPTRVVPRKGIELAIDLLAELADERDVLVITHQAGDEGRGYLDRLRDHATARKVHMRHVADRIAERRGTRDGRKVYSLWDIYPHADFVTYPSLYEGFGNALVECVYFRKPALVNRYSVYVADIAPRGFDFVECDRRVGPGHARAVARLLDDPDERRRVCDANWKLGAEHFSYRALRRLLEAELRALGVVW